MMKSLRPLALVAACSVMAGVRVASAQTVIVREAPAGSAVELVLNSTALGSAVADASGDATLPLNLSAQVKTPEIEANVSVHVCEGVHRVVVAERGSPAAPPAAGCERRDISGLFLVRRVSSLVIDVGSPNPTMLLVQGAYSLSPEGPGKVWHPAASGLVLSGGGGYAKFRDARALACGDVAPCDGDTAWGALHASVAYWFVPFVAAEVGYVKPPQLSVEGRGNTFRFNTDLDVHLLTIAGKVGAPIGPIRIYGQAGMNYHRSTSGTTQTFDDVTVTIDGVPQTVTGGTQTFELETAGWGWQFGGGIEAWMTQSIGIYAEAGRMTVKGSAVQDGEGAFDDALTSVFVGARFRIGR